MKLSLGTIALIALCGYLYLKSENFNFENVIRSFDGISNAKYSSNLPELPPPAPPKINLSELQTILEINVHQQVADVQIDTIVNVLREIRWAWTNFKVWDYKTTARTKMAYGFIGKAGSEILCWKLIGTTILIDVSEPKISSLESDISKMRSLVTDFEKENYDVFINEKYITAQQRAEIYAKAKQLAKDKLIEEGILLKAKQRITEVITSIVSIANPDYIVQINFK